MVKSASSFSNLERWELERPDFATFFKDKPRDSLNFLKIFPYFILVTSKIAYNGNVFTNIKNIISYKKTKRGIYHE